VTAVRLAVVVPSLRPGLRYWPAMVESLERHGIRVQVFTGLAPAGPQPLKLNVIRGARLLRPRPAARHTAKAAFFMPPRLAVELVRARPDAILSVEYTIATVWSVLAARLLRRRVYIYQEHGNGHDAGLTVGRRLYRRWLSRLADGLIANTPAAEEEIVTALGADRRRVVRIPLMSPPAREALKRVPVAVQAPRVRPLFLFVGALIPRKNTAILLQAVHRLGEQGRACSLWIAGDGPERPGLEAERNRLGLEATVQFVGALPYESMGSLYEACDVLVMPTHYDYRSVAVLEAMRFGKAVIDSKLDGNAGDTVRHGVNGFVFDPGDAGELAARMAELVDNPRRIEEMGQASARIMASHSLAMATGRLAQLIRDAPPR
jgi:glycosyltransferase involved in cell wall biosynthesis